MTTSSVPLIEVQALRRNYGAVVAVAGLSFSVGRGEVVGFLGPNGAGKSTTLRMIVGYLGPSSGRVIVNGFDVVEEPLLARRAIGYMPETTPLYPEMRVKEYLGFRARLKGLPRRGLKQHIDQILDKAGIVDVARALIGTLSRGYRQRVALADALIGNPPLLILDEPTAGLDPNQIHSFRTLIQELGASHTVLLSTHILSEVESTCGRAIVIDRGVLVAEGSIAALRQRRGAQRAVVIVHDRRQQALALMVAAPHVLGVTPVSATPSLAPPAPDQTGDAVDPLARDEVVSYIVTFEPGIDGHDCLEDLVASLSRSEIRVREARLHLTSLEDVFRQLTLANTEGL